jgi:hypothetical protein
MYDTTTKAVSYGAVPGAFSPTQGKVSATVATITTAQQDIASVTVPVGWYNVTAIIAATTTLTSAREHIFNLTVKSSAGVVIDTIAIFRPANTTLTYPMIDTISGVCQIADPTYKLVLDGRMVAGSAAIDTATTKIIYTRIA